MAAVAIQGLREFRRDLKRLDADLGKQFRQANLAAAEVVVPEARRRAPRGPHEGGGRIRPIVASIRALASQRAGFVAAGGARTPHAAVYEWGGTIPRRHFAGITRTQKRRGVRVTATGERITTRRSVAGERLIKASLTRIAARPYLRPALEAKTDEVVKVYGEALDRLLRRAFPEGGR